jgi:hypothetical protein
MTRCSQNGLQNANLRRNSLARSRGHATTVQIAAKDSRKYASTAGTGFGHFIDGKAVDRAQHETYFDCRQANAKSHGHIFSQLAP